MRKPSLLGLLSSLTLGVAFAAFIYLILIRPSLASEEPTENLPPAPEMVERIAFVSDRDGDSEIYSMNPDGSDQIRLTDSPGSDDGPVWSPDGRWLAFGSSRDVNTGLEYVMRPDGSEVTRLTQELASTAYRVWSHDATRIAFLSSSTDSSFYDLYTVGLDGSTEVILADGADPAGEPAWSPNGSQIAYVSWQEAEGQQGISLVNTADGLVTTVPNSAGAMQFDWSHDGTRIAFLSPGEGGSGLTLVSPDGSSESTRIADNLAGILGPRWSPDGTKLAFYGYEADSADNAPQALGLYVVNADGTDLTRIVDAVENPPYSGLRTVVWSPTGSQIAFAAGVDGTYTAIFTVNADGTGLTQITDESANNSSPSWGLVRVSPEPPPADGLPDLHVFSAGSHPNRPYCYGPHTRTGALVTIENIGTAAAGPFALTVSGVERRVSGLEAGTSTEIWIADNEFPQPWKIITVVVDPANEIEESSEDNNQFETIPMTLTPPAPCTPTGTAETPTPGATPTSESPLATDVPIVDSANRIAFVSDRDGNIEIYVMNSDGTGLVRVTNTVENESFPSWSPDGTRLAFYRLISPDTFDGNLYIVNADGSGEVVLQGIATGYRTPQAPMWSPDGTRLAFTSPGNSPDDLTVSLMNVDGSNLTKVADGRLPVWSPDGSQIAYLSPESMPYLMNADGSNQRQLADLPDKVVYLPLWSPDGSQLLVMGDAGDHAVIYTVNTDGSGFQEVTSSATIGQGAAEWSPDGQWITFSSMESFPGGAIYRIRPDGSEQTLLLDSLTWAYSPLWSSDGTLLAFTGGQAGGSADIFVMHPDGSGLRQLTELPSVDRAPRWQP